MYDENKIAQNWLCCRTTERTEGLAVNSIAETP
jgi:hypothetical protein